MIRVIDLAYGDADAEELDWGLKGKDNCAFQTPEGPGFAILGSEWACATRPIVRIGDAPVDNV